VRCSEAASDSSADFFPWERLASIRVKAGSDVNLRRFSDGLYGSFRQQIERCYRLCRIRLCLRDRARRVLALDQSLKTPGGLDQSSRRAFSCMIRREKTQERAQSRPVTQSARNTSRRERCEAVAERPVLPLRRYEIDDNFFRPNAGIPRRAIDQWNAFLFNGAPRGASRRLGGGQLANEARCITHSSVTNRKSRHSGKIAIHPPFSPPGSQSLTNHRGAFDRD